MSGELFDLLVAAVMLCCGLLVAFDAHRLGRSMTETLLWGVFAGWFILIGPIFYLFFRSKFYK